jgi:hypothetical protein
MWTLSQVAQAIKNSDWTGVPPSTVEYLIVAGGGSGGFTYGAGGGAGGLLQGFAGIAPGTSYFVTIGAGGASNGASTDGNTGSASVFDATGSGASTGRIVATGGGGAGGSSGTATAGKSGGSGGGAGGFGGLRGGTGISGQGNAGGAAVSTSNYGSGGGGGAGTVGFAGTTTSGGNGGAGIASDITGTRVVYAGGGGGGIYETGSPGIGGAGGGASCPSTANVNGNPGQPNTGGGGSGNIMNGTVPGLTSGAGGSGIVVIRYPGNVQFFTGGTLNYSNGFMVHTFYSSGTLVPATPRLFATPDYQIARSLRFNSADGALLERAGSSGGNRQTWTWSGWVKRSKLNTGNNNPPFLFGASDRSSGSAYLQFGTYGSDSAIDCLSFQEQSGGSYIIVTQAKFRDMSAWYHVVCAYDTTQSTASDRVKIYVNGVLQTITSGGTYPPQNTNGYVNYSAFPYLIGAYSTGDLNYTLNGYMAEVNFVDGQQLTPASFGYTEPSTGVWTPLQYTGSYGTRGFYLNFADNSNTTAATLGKDLSGNANNFTPTNFSVTAGVNNDSLVDSPTNYGTDTGAGGEVRGNYATFNPLQRSYGTIAYSDGNLVATNSDFNWNAIGATMGISTGKWYWEYTSGAQNSFFGFQVPTINYSAVNPQDANAAAGSVLLCDDNQYKIDNNSRVSYGSTYHPSGTVVGIAVDMDAGTVIFYKNGTSLGSINWSSSVAYGKTVVPMAVVYDNGTVTRVNFGQRPFAYTAPSGYKALCTQNLAESAAGKLPGKYFGATTYTGINTTRPIATGVDMATYGGLLWTKGRDLAVSNFLIDTVRGFTKYLATNSTIAEDTYDFGFTSTSFGVTTTNGSGSFNQSPYNYVAWNWAAGGTAVTNTAGSITSTVSANTAAGFSIATYTGVTNGTVGHGLGVAPSMIVVKSRGAQNWFIYHTGLGNTQYMTFSTDSATTNSGSWNNTSPTSSVFTSGSYFSTNSMVAYCWAEVPGYSRFGSYTGNGSADGPFIYCGFRPKYVLIKRTDSNAAGPDWYVFDAARNTYNDGAFTNMYINTSNVESTGWPIDFVSNGFKIRYAGATNYAGLHIFAAFAESPFKYARAR